MRICNLCRQQIKPHAPVHALTGNHWSCEVKRDAIPDWQRLLAEELAKLPADNLTPRAPLPRDPCQKCGEDLNHPSAIIRGGRVGHRC